MTGRVLRTDEPGSRWRLRTTGPDRFETEISAEWCIGAFANGGYLLSLALQAAAAVVNFPDALTATAHYLAPVTSGTATLAVDTVRVGRTLARVLVRMTQNGKDCMTVLAALGRLLDDSASLHTSAPSFALAPLERCTRMALGTPDGGDAAVRRRFDTRYDPSSVGWARGSPAGRPEISAWVRAEDGSEPDGSLLAVVVDAMPCTAFDLGIRHGSPRSS